MKILFDQGTPVPLRRHLHPGQVDTAAEMGWSELSNGQLLAAAELAGFDLLVTTSHSCQLGGKVGFRAENRCNAIEIAVWTGGMVVHHLISLWKNMIRIV